MMRHPDPNRGLKLGLGIGASGALAIGGACLPSSNLLAQVGAIALPTLGLGGSIASIAKANEYEQQDRIEAENRERWQALQQDMDDAMLLSSQAFYTANPGAWTRKLAVPDSWHEQYMRARYAPLPELRPAPTQPMSQQAIEQRPATAEKQPATPSPFSAPIQHQSFESFSAPDDAWLDTLVSPSALLLYGGDGSGKTSLAIELIHRRLAAGHQAIALDPHAAPGKWPGETIGAGLDYSAIETAIGNLQRIIKQRYEAIAAGQNPESFQPITVVAEELTDWSSSVSNSDLLIRKAGDYRKAKICLLMIGHGDSLGQIGAPRGFSAVAENCLTKLQLFAQPGADGRPTPAFKGQLKRPHAEPIAVSVPRFTDHSPEPTPATPEPTTLPSFDLDIADPVRGSFVDVQTPEPAKIEPSAQPEPENDREAELLQQFAEFKALGMNKAQIVFALWHAKKGGSAAYKTASEFYDRLLIKYQEINGENAA